MVHLVLYSRDGCHLCEDMIEHLNQLKEDYPFELEIRDVDSLGEWFNRYNELVPVLESDGQEICRYFLDQQQLIELLKQ